MLRISMGVVLVLLTANAAVAIPTGVETGAETEIGARADAFADKNNDAAEFLREIDYTMTLALAGEYGGISGADVDRLKKARDTIVLLLKDQVRATDLEPEQRLALYNAQEVMTSILRNDEKNRQVCAKVVAIGSRLPRYECMTVGDREERRRLNYEKTVQIQRPFGPPPGG